MGSSPIHRTRNFSSGVSLGFFVTGGDISMKKIFLLVLSCILHCLLLFFPRMASAEETPLDRAQLELLCAMVSASSYDRDLNLVVRRRLQEMGWEYEPIVEMSSAAVANIFLVHKQLSSTDEEIYILAVRGTSNAKDAAVDFRFRMVPFGGTRPKEFFLTASRSDLGASYPAVHQGFNDYAMTALFRNSIGLRIDNGTFGELLVRELLEHPHRKLILTGHSLGGAVAVLTAARMSDMGVPANQLDVIAFGAPAVGNASFVQQYEPRFSLSCISIEGDPVKNILQTIYGGYVPFGRSIERKENRNSRRFSHEMVVYLDDAIRNFYDVRKEFPESTMNYLEETRPSAKARVYVPRMQFRLDCLIANDEEYMRMAARDALAGRISDPVFGEENEKTSLLALCEEGRAHGCDYILLEEFAGKRIKEDTYNFRITMEEHLYDVDGHFLGGQSTSTTTKKMTPIEAVLYVQMAGQELRENTIASNSPAQDRAPIIQVKK